MGGGSTSNSTNESSSYANSETDQTGESSSETKSVEERFESAVIASELARLPDIESSGIVAGYFEAPHLPVWRAELSLDEIRQFGVVADEKTKKIDCDDEPHLRPSHDDSFRGR